MTTEDGEILLGRRELVHGDGHQIVAELETGLLVEIVTDPRAV